MIVEFILLKEASMESILFMSASLLSTMSSFPSAALFFLRLDILNGGFFKSKEKFCPPNGHGVVFANKLRNVTSIPTGPALHALLLEVDTLFRDVKEPIVFFVPMSTKISAKDLALSFILHAPYPDFYFIVGCHP
jgi:hypothetical protein